MGVEEGTNRIMQLRQLAANHGAMDNDPFMPGTYPVAAMEDETTDDPVPASIPHPIPEALSEVAPPLHTRVIAKIREAIRPYLRAAA